MSKNDQIFSKFPALKELYPEDVQEIEQEQERMKVLLSRQEFANNPTTIEFKQKCMEEIVDARMKLATDRTLLDNESAQRELWAIIDARMWFLELVSPDFDTQVAYALSMLEEKLHP